MSRHRQFDEDDVLQAAARAFVTHGYQGTSMAMLLEATALGKQSLYNGFGDKRALYLKALDCAVARFEPLARAMQQQADGRAAIEHYFQALGRDCASDDPAERACIVSAGLLEGIDDALIRERLLAKWAGTRELLRESVERGQRDGSIASALPSATLADLLMSLVSGLRVSAQAETSTTRLQQITALVLSLLDRAD